MASLRSRRLRPLCAWTRAVIRIDSIWLATEPLDMRAGTETALVRVVQVFGAAQPHCAYLFTKKRANRAKVLVHDSFGIWLAARRLNKGRFVWSGNWQGQQLELSPGQLQALVVGLLVFCQVGILAHCTELKHSAISITFVIPGVNFPKFFSW